MAIVGATQIHAIAIPRIFYNLYAEKVLNLSIAAIRSGLGISQLVVIPLVLMVPFISRRFGKERTFSIAILVSVSSAILMTLVPTAPAAVTALFVANIGMAVSNPVFNQYSQEIVPTQPGINKLNPKLLTYNSTYCQRRTGNQSRPCPRSGTSFPV